MSKRYYPPKGELSYYGLSLLSYLRDSHPNLATDEKFVRDRADRAAEAYSVAVKAGLTHTEAEEAANAFLYRGLHFSPYNTLVNILWDEFSVQIPENDARTVALLMLPLCHDVFAKYSESREINQARLSLSEAHPVFYKYPLSDDFAGTPQYEALYTELVGTVQILLEDGRL